MSILPRKRTWLLGLLAAGSYWLWRQAEEPAIAGAAARSRAKPAAGSAKGGWDAVDEASAQSFPASDPPGTY